MKKIINIILSLLIIFPSIITHTNADFVVNFKNSSINWTNGIIIANGRYSITIGKNGLPVTFHGKNITTINKARMEAYQIAKDKAIENIIHTIKSIRVDPDSMFTDLINSDRLTQKRISEAIMHLINVKEYPADFFSSHCEAKIKLGDIIASIPYDFPSQNFPIRDDIPIETRYSALIIDGREIGIKPMLFPSVYTEDGLEIYGRDYVDSKYAAKNGLVSYCYNENEAMKNYRAGDRPYFTSAIKSIKGCPVISERDARKILSSNYTINNLKKCNVIIILNKK